MKLASIDIGTNTLRLLIGNVDRSGNIADTILKREITRLGGGVENGLLRSDAKARTLEALERFSSIIKKNSVKKVSAAATSVVRDAKNGGLFVKEIKDKTGIDVNVISGEFEGALTLKGVVSALDGKNKIPLVFDIGGGSTEFILAGNEKVERVATINMGVVALAENKLKSDPPSAADITNIIIAVDDYIHSLEVKSPLFFDTDFVSQQNNILVGTAGTITTLAAIDQDMELYDSRKINNYVLKYESVKNIFHELSGLTHEERAGIKALEKGRADLIIPGTLIVMRVMKALDFNELVVSDYGLLEGLLIEMAENI